MKKIAAVLLTLVLVISVIGCSKVTNQKSNDEGKDNQLLQANNEVSQAIQAAENYVKKINYKVAPNSGANLTMRLPNTFEDKYKEYEIGEFLKKKNEESKKNGFDFKEYMGKEVMLIMYASDTQDKDLFLLISEGKVVGAWKGEQKMDPDKGIKDDFHVIMDNTKNI